MHRLLSPVVLLAVLAASMVGLPSAAAAADMDCDDFATQAAAQTFFLGAGPGDPHRLDAEGDGRACESNPCPCIGGATPAPLVTQTTPPSPTTQPSSGTDPDGSGSSGPVRRDRGTVVRITDGDTLVVQVRGVGVRSVRILGIDTPEVYFVAECGGEAASAHLERLTPVGSRVRLVSDPGQAARDRYGRWLRYVARGALDVGREMIVRGYARTYVHRDDPFRRTRDYRRAERVARNLLRGSWDGCW